MTLDMQFRRRKTYIAVLFVATLAACVSTALAQRMTERWLTVNPLCAPISADQESTWTCLPSAHAWGEFGPYRFVRDNDHAWSVKLGGFLELFRVRSRGSLAFLSSIDLIADSHNEMNFNPRAVFWEEGFLYTIRSGNLHYQLGYYHRCKHDIDNLLPAPSYPYQSVQRALMYGSVLAKVLVPCTLSDDSARALLAFRFDLYTILQDDRLPKALMTVGTNLEQAIGSLGINLHAQSKTNSDWLGLYLSSYASATFYGNERGFTKRFRRIESASLSGGLSGGLVFQGAIHLRLGLSYEYLADTGINAVPSSGHLILLSTTIVNPTSMW